MAEVEVDSKPVVEEAATDAATVRIATWNIWFADFGWEDRLKLFASQLLEEDADVVAIQEMTPHFLPVLTELLAERYRASTDRLRQRYDVVLFSKWEFASIRAKHFDNSHMARNVLIGQFKPEGLPPLTVATSHLESMAAAKTRREQFMESMALLAEQRNAVFCGDCNFFNEGENPPLSDGWQDAWLAAGRPVDCEECYTYDSATNAVIRDGFRNRLDRMYFRSSCSAYKLSSIERFGMATTATDYAPRLFASDHYGLVLTLAVDAEGAELDAAAEKESGKRCAVA